MTVTLVIKPVTPPLDIAAIYMKQDSGKLLGELLSQIGPAGNLHHAAARAYRALAFLCLSVGLPLTYTYGGTYRTYQQQVTLFLQRYTTMNLGEVRPTKVWNGVTYWLRPNMAAAAVPGKSNHGWGIAVDFAFDSDVTDGLGPDDAAGITGHPQWPKFAQWALDCGWSWESTAEPWHLRLVTGSTPTQTVLAVEAIMFPPDPSEEDEMQTARLIRFKGFINVFLVGGGGPPMAVGGADYDHLVKLGVPKVFVDHTQEMLSVIRAAGLDPNDEDELVPGGPTDRF